MQHTISLHAPESDREDAFLPPSTFRRVAEMTTRLLDVPVAMVRVTGSGPGKSLPSWRIRPSVVARIDAAVAPLTDATLRVLENPARAAARFGLGFHANAPVKVRAGPKVGTLDIFGVAPRHLEAADRQILEDLAAVAAEEIEIWLAAAAVLTGRSTVAFEREVNDDTSILLAALRDAAAYEDPAAIRPAICRIASSLTGADSAALYEIAEGDLMVMPTVTVGASRGWPLARLSDGAMPVVRAYVTGKAVLDVDGSPPTRSADASRATHVPAVSFWQPFAAGGPTTAAVIALVWDRARSVAPARVTRLMDTLAAEAIRAIERADLLVRLDELTRTDELTGLPNRRALNDALPREMERARRERHGLCLAMLDLDHFKRYNDVHGHPAGDRLLAAAAATWREALRSGTDLLARYGGEEFAVVLPTSPQAAYDTLERIRRSTPNGQTVSIGLASWDGSEPIDGLVARADAALYLAKAAGRDQIHEAPAPTDATTSSSRDASL